MQNEDQMEVEILEDGSIKLAADKISAANHMNAEQLIRSVQELAGGKVSRRRKGAGLPAQVQHSHGQQQKH